MCICIIIKLALCTELRKTVLHPVLRHIHIARSNTFAYEVANLIWKGKQNPLTGVYCTKTKYSKYNTFRNQPNERSPMFDTYLHIVACIYASKCHVPNQPKSVARVSSVALCAARNDEDTIRYVQGTMGQRTPISVDVHVLSATLLFMYLYYMKS